MSLKVMGLMGWSVDEIKEFLVKVKEDVKKYRYPLLWSHVSPAIPRKGIGTDQASRRVVYGRKPSVES
jgi:hypothetical protein